MLIVERASGSLHDAHIRDLLERLRPGDILALNETRVRPARLEVRRLPTGGHVELLFVRPVPTPAGTAAGPAWRVLARPA